MRVLLLYPYLPSPECHHGSARLLSRLLEDLRPHAEITLIAGYRPKEKPLLPGVEALVHRLYPVPRPFAEDLSPLARIGEAVSTFRKLRSSPWPIPVQKLMRRGFHEALKSAFSTSSFDIFHAELGVMAPYVLDVPPHIPSVLVDHESLGEGLRYRHLLDQAYSKFQRIVTLCEEDKARLRNLGAQQPISVRPPGIDVPSQVRRSPQAGTVLFFGSPNHQPNADALEWISSEILPRLARLTPHLEFRCAGFDPGSRAGGHLAASSSTKLLGFVDRIEDEIDRAAVVLSPVRLGSGVRIKNLEALSRGAPLVTTTLGAQGFALARESGCRVVDGPDAIAEAVAELLAHPEQAESMGARGRQWVQQHFSREQQCRLTLSLWRELLGS